MSASNHSPILKFLLVQSAEAANELGTGVIALAVGSYWNTALSQPAWVLVMVE